MGTSDDELERADGHPVGPAGDAAGPADSAAAGAGSLFESAPGRDTPPRPERVVMSPGNPPNDVRGDPDDDPAPEDSGGHRLRARPYVLTKGRTRARPDLAVETLISAEPTAPWQRNLGAEHQAIRRLCAQPRSVAEIAATLSVPLGVARVLVSDLADTGFVRVHAAPTTSGGRPGPELMNRVLAGLQRL